MTNVVIEILAKASQYTSEGDPNPFCAHIGEALSKDVERNFSGFLVRTCAISFKVNSQKLILRIALLKDRLLIARLVGLKPFPQYMESWLKVLIHKLRGTSLASRKVKSSYHV
jgi:hypothetical protein